MQKITVPLEMDVDLYREVLALSEYDKEAGFSDTVTRVLRGVVKAWLECHDARPNPVRFLDKWEKQHPTECLLEELAKMQPLASEVPAVNRLR